MAYIGPYCWRWTSLFGRAVITFDAVLTACYWACFSHQIACMMHRPRLFCILRGEQGPESMEGLAWPASVQARHPTPRFYRRARAKPALTFIDRPWAPCASAASTSPFYCLAPSLLSAGPIASIRFYQTGALDPDLSVASTKQVWSLTGLEPKPFGRQIAREESLSEQNRPSHTCKQSM